VTLLQSPGARPLALFGQSAGELFVLTPLFFELVSNPPLFFFQPPDLAALKLQLQRHCGLVTVSFKAFDTGSFQIPSFHRSTSIQMFAVRSTSPLIKGHLLL